MVLEYLYNGPKLREIYNALPDILPVYKVVMLAEELVSPDLAAYLSGQGGDCFCEPERRRVWRVPFSSVNLEGYVEAEVEVCTCSCGPVDYFGGFHCYASETSAQMMSALLDFCTPYDDEDPPPPVNRMDMIQCLAKKSWITAIGIYGGCLVYVCSALVAPRYPYKVVRAEDFDRIIEITVTQQAERRI